MLVKIDTRTLIDPKLVETVDRHSPQGYSSMQLSNGTEFRVAGTVDELLRIINEGLIASEWLE